MRYITRRLMLSIGIAALVALTLSPAFAQEGFGPGERVMLDAHNCYPYQGRWEDRLERALSTGFPISIEQDLVWQPAPVAAASRSIVSHGKPYTGEEPSLESYFFEAVRPHVQRALSIGDTSTWPIIVLNLDFKDDEEAHVREIAGVMSRYADWITSAPKTEDLKTVAPMDVKPILVLSAGGGNQFKVFYDDLNVGDPVRVFGAARTRGRGIETPADMVTEPADNFRRWWNGPWSIVEEGGQRRAGDWTAEDRARLDALVQHAHDMGYWLRIYTINGHEEANNGMGWSGGYNFGTLQAAEQRWRACAEAGVDFIPSDMYEEASAVIRRR